MKLIAAFLRNNVDPQPLSGGIRNGSARLINHFLVSGVVLVTLNGAITLQTVDDHSIVQNGGLSSAGTMHIEVGLLHGLRTAHVRRGQCHTDNELPDGLDGVSVRHHIEYISGKNLCLHCRLNVDDGRLARHRHRLGDRADGQVRVDVCRERPLQFDAFASTGRAESGFTRLGRAVSAASGDVMGLARRLDEISKKSATARVDLAGNKEALAQLDRLDLKMAMTGNKVMKPNVSVEGVAKASVEISALDVELDRLSRLGGDRVEVVGQPGLESREHTSDEMDDRAEVGEGCLRREPGLELLSVLRGEGHPCHRAPFRDHP